MTLCIFFAHEIPPNDKKSLGRNPCRRLSCSREVKIGLIGFEWHPTRDLEFAGGRYLSAMCIGVDKSRM